MRFSSSSIWCAIAAWFPWVPETNAVQAPTAFLPDGGAGHLDAAAGIMQMPGDPGVFMVAHAGRKPHPARLEKRSAAPDKSQAEPKPVGRKLPEPQRLGRGALPEPSEAADRAALLALKAHQSLAGGVQPGDVAVGKAVQVPADKRKPSVRVRQEPAVAIRRKPPLPPPPTAASSLLQEAVEDGGASSQEVSESNKQASPVTTLQDAMTLIEAADDISAGGLGKERRARQLSQGGSSLLQHAAQADVHGRGGAASGERLYSNEPPPYRALPEPTHLYVREPAQRASRAAPPPEPPRLLPEPKLRPSSFVQRSAVVPEPPPRRAVPEPPTRRAVPEPPQQQVRRQQSSLLEASQSASQLQRASTDRHRHRRRPAPEPLPRRRPSSPAAGGEAGDELAAALEADDALERPVQVPERARVVQANPHSVFAALRTSEVGQDVSDDAAAGGAADSSADKRELFIQSDYDKSGFLEDSELSVLNDMFQSKFDRPSVDWAPFDGDGDGALSLPEFQAAMEAAITSDADGVEPNSRA
eukprot:TRINITY_DN34406_c0_g1_i1.p1 TRINITY_DN34406_c0_g1~~TRINITY_DN34406_c0_g1_i1.p1  ORF type:complete len:529 (+),score=118.89 TRINITY_DN34406_c0_g1_i1:85-1671(+)